MIELLIVLLIAAFIVASKKSIGLANPFQIYFGSWVAVFISYWLSRETYVAIDFEFTFLLLTASLLAIAIFAVSIIRYQLREKDQPAVVKVHVSNAWLYSGQVAVLLTIPLAYAKALSLAQGYDILSVQGYTALRASMTQDGEGFGVIAYMFVLSYVITSVRVFVHESGLRNALLLWVSIISSLFFAYIGTGRTGILLLLCLCAVPLVVSGRVRLKGLVVAVVLTAVLFLTVAIMTAKGVSLDEDLVSNAESIQENIRAYTTAPTLAMSTLFNGYLVNQYGENSFRFFISLLNSLNIISVSPVSLVREYAYVPMATNVYTVYEVYYRDFSVFGMYIPPMFLIFHWWLYKRARRYAGRWLFFYAASAYPLVMQFFQDQYFSLLSTWIQVAFWYFVIIKIPKACELQSK